MLRGHIFPYNDYRRAILSLQFHDFHLLQIKKKKGIAENHGNGRKRWLVTDN
jgi:hypothetical protein